MARAKRWNVVSASISLLLLAGLADAEPSRQVDLPVGVPVEVPLAGLDQALATDPSIVRAEVDPQRGVLRLTGLLLHQETVVFAWTAESTIVFTAKVVAPPEDPSDARRRARVQGEGAGSLYRFSLGSGFRKTETGSRQLPFAFGAAAFKPIGTNRLTFSGNTRPFGEDREDHEATGSAVMQWRGDGYRIAAGDQAVELGPHLITGFPLRGVVSETQLGPATVTAFAGGRTTAELQLVPEEREADGQPRMIGGLRCDWTVGPRLRLSSVVAMSDTEPLASLSAEWKRQSWTALVEAATTAERQGATVRLRRETDTVTFEQRFNYRTAATSAILSGADGFGSETAMTYRFTRAIGVSGRLALHPFDTRTSSPGSWYVGGDWAPATWLSLAGGVDRALDGSVTTTSGTVTTQSATWGSATLTVARTVQDTVDGAQWFQALRAERPVDLGIVKRFMVEESLTHGPLAGSLALSAGPEIEAGWLRAAVAPGVVIPTVTDPNGIAQTLRLRLTATPSQAFQVQTEVRQTFGAKPDTTVQFGVGLGFGSASPLGTPVSWFARTAVEGIVFLDDNGNGQWDVGERGLSGVPVKLEDGTTVVTDEKGRYRLTGLKDGVHRVSVDRDNLPANLRLASASPVAVRLPDDARPVSFAFVGSGVIHGMIFNDVRRSKRYTGTEPGVAADVVVEGAGVRRQIAANGPFSVAGLAPGRYRVSVDPLSLPPAFTLERTEIEVEIGAGESGSAQFPATALRAIAIVACLGRADGACERDDRPAIGLRLTAGTTTVVTDASGRALIRDLPAGRLTITVDPASIPAGWAAPRPQTFDLPSDPTSLPVTIRLTPARR